MDPFRAEITLASGRRIELRWLRQELVYGGLLEGLPTRETNSRKVDRYVSEARALGAPVYVLEVDQRPVAYQGTYPFGVPAALPRIVCTGGFRSQPARDASKDYSELTVVWFQEAFAFPIDAQPLSQLAALRWEDLAADDEL